MDPFATLGLARRYDLDPVELERRYRELQKTLHPDRHVGAPASLRRITLGKAVEVNEAYRMLRDAVPRAEALLALLGAGLPASTHAAPTEFLMEIMELREALSESKQVSDGSQVRALAQRVEALQATTQSALAQAFAAITDDVAAGALHSVGALVAKMKYYQRFLDEVRAIEDDAHA